MADPQLLTTHTGFRFEVRTAGPDDKAGLADLFEHLEPDDLRFRFLSGVKRVAPAQIAAMADVDHEHTENFLAVLEDDRSVIASAMLAVDATGLQGEVAVATRTDFKGRGVSWTLLKHVAREAKARGLKEIVSIESSGHRAAIDLEREMGFTAETCPDDASLTILRADLTGH